VGVRDTPRQLTATLLTLCSIALVGAPAPALAAHAGRPAAKSTRHGGKATKHRPRHHAHKTVHRRAFSRSLGNGGTPSTTPKPRTSHQHARHLAPPAAPRERPSAKHSAPIDRGAAVIASVLATPCQNTEITPSASNVAIAREAVLCLINRVRAEHNLEPLTVSARLEAAAEGHCSELISDDYFAHVSPGGETPVDRIKATGYIPGPSVGYVIGENLAWGTYVLSTPQAIVSAWVASPGHLANILESQYKETGIGITPAVPRSLGEGNPGATFAQEFGVIIH
jgi:uncharacterized protein YkwD